MKKDSFKAFLPRNLFDDDLSQSFQKDEDLIEHYDQSIDDTLTRASIDQFVPIPSNLRNNSSHKLTSDLRIEDEANHLITAKKKYSEQLPKNAFGPQHYSSMMPTPTPMRMYTPHQPNQMFNANNWMINQRMRTIQSCNSIYNPQYNAYKPQGQRKAFTTKEDYVDLSNQSEHVLYEKMSINQIITFKGPLAFIDFIKNSKGSRLIQGKLHYITQEEINLILSSLVGYFTEIMCDYYANYFFKKIIEFCSPKQRIGIYRNIQKDFVSIANSQCGTHCIQKLILLHNTIEEEEIIRQIIDGIIPCLAFGDNSSHVIQKLLMTIPETRREYLNTFILSNLIDLSLSPNGICIVKEFINNNQSANLSEILISAFESETTKLTCDQYGNYGIQEVIQRFGYCRCFKIVKQLKDQLVFYSSMKFSSNVIDFLIKYSQAKAIEVFNEIIHKLFFTYGIFNEMTKSKYGNFVLENAILLLDHVTLLKVKKAMSSNCILNSERDKEKKIFKLIKAIKE